MAARQAAPRRAGPTHFVCIPLARRQLARSIRAFAAAATDINSFALPPDAVRPPSTLHLTLGVMSLPRQEQLEKALQLLRDLKLRDILSQTRTELARRSKGLAGASPTPRQHQPLTLTLKGLHAMQDPKTATVLYAPPLDADEGSVGVLYAFCAAVRTAFVDAGLMESDSRPFVLHATVVNTIHVKGRRRERLVLDARDILGAYEEHVWLDRHEVRTVAVCKMGARDIGGGDAAYEVVEEVAI